MRQTITQFCSIALRLLTHVQVSIRCLFNPIRPPGEGAAEARMTKLTAVNQKEAVVL